MTPSLYAGPTHLSFIVATTGRASLGRMLKSIHEQPLTHEDQVLIIGNDGLKKHEWAAHDMRGVPWVYFPCEPGGDWGHTERNLGMIMATGTHLVFGDDDDAFLPGAVTAIRKAADRNPGRPLMFRMFDANGAVLWGLPQIQMGNHGTPQFVPPNVPDRLGQFGHRYEGDFDFVTSTLALYPTPPEKAVIWCADVIYGCRSFGG